MSVGSGGKLPLAEVLGATYQLAAVSFFLYFALAFIANTPNLLVDFLMPSALPPGMPGATPETQHPRLALQGYTVIWLIALIVVGILLSFVLSASATHLMIARLRRTRFDLSEALVSGLRALPPLLGTCAILMLFFFGIILVAVLIWAALAYGVVGNPKSPVGLLIFPLVFVPMAIVGIRLSMLVPVIVVERPGVIGSLRRSFELTKDSAWKIVGLLLIMVLGMFAINAVVFAIVVAMFGLAAHASPVFSVAQNALVSAEVVFFWALTAVMYYYLRSAEESSAAMPA
jgi:Membrane domain of glycerophosphoryl diester phosphodiesterase